MAQQNPIPPEAKVDGVNAYQPTPAGAVIRTRGYRTDDGEHREAIEIADGDDVTVLYDDVGTVPTQVYNKMVESFIELEEFDPELFDG